MLLTVDKLWVYYGQVQALRDVSVYADDGEIVSVIGLNGAGKSFLDYCGVILYIFLEQKKVIHQTAFQPMLQPL